MVNFMALQHVVCPNSAPKPRAVWRKVEKQRTSLDDDPIAEMRVLKLIQRNVGFYFGVYYHTAHLGLLTRGLCAPRHTVIYVIFVIT